MSLLPPTTNGTPRFVATRRLVPSIITLLALASGMTAIRFAVAGKFDAAVLAIMLAAILDILDGRVAILFKATSKFGAELDSLSDLTSFGVAPAIMMYLWSLQFGGSLGWLATLIFVLCSALRLARYNTISDALPETASPRAKKTFVGVPTPAGAGLVLMPMIFSVEWETDWLAGEPKFLALWTAIIALLMVSRLPTPALKGWRLPAPFVLPVLIFVGILAASLVTEPFLTLSILGLGYLASLPCFYIWQRRQPRA